MRSVVGPTKHTNIHTQSAMQSHKCGAYSGSPCTSKCTDSTYITYKNDIVCDCKKMNQFCKKLLGRLWVTFTLHSKLGIWHSDPTNNKPLGNSFACRLCPTASRTSLRTFPVGGLVEFTSQWYTTFWRHAWALPPCPVNRAPIASKSPIGISSSIPNAFHSVATGFRSFIKQWSSACIKQ